MGLIETEIRRRGWSKKEFAEKLGESTQNYNNWRQRGIPAEKRLKVARLLGWSIEDMLEGRPPASAKQPDDARLSARQRALVDLFDGLTSQQQGAVIRELEETKQHNDALLNELSKMRKNKG